MLQKNIIYATSLYNLKEIGSKVMKVDFYELYFLLKGFIVNLTNVFIEIWQRTRAVP